MLTPNNKYMLRLFNNGDIDIITNTEIIGEYKIVYHKTYYAGETIKQNLKEAYRVWEILTNKEEKII